MRLLVKSLALVLAVLALAMPLAALAHCEDDHAAECATECACACHSAPASMHNEHANGLSTARAERTCVTDATCLGRLSTADIFRPPTAF